MKAQAGNVKSAAQKVTSKYGTPAKLVVQPPKHAPATEQFLSAEFIAEVNKIEAVSKSLHRSTPTSPLSLTNELDENYVEQSQSRPLPQARESVPESVHLALWNNTIAAPGKLSATKLESLFVARRDRSKTIEELSVEFKIDKEKLEELFKYLSAPHLDFDEETKLYYGTWEKKYRVD
jgi:hypothetical protein